MAIAISGKPRRFCTRSFNKNHSKAFLTSCPCSIVSRSVVFHPVNLTNGFAALRCIYAKAWKTVVLLLPQVIHWRAHSNASAGSWNSSRVRGLFLIEPYDSVFSNPRSREQFIQARYHRPPVLRFCSSALYHVCHICGRIFYFYKDAAISGNAI